MITNYSSRKWYARFVYIYDYVLSSAKIISDCVVENSFWHSMKKGKNAFKEENSLPLAHL